MNTKIRIKNLRTIAPDYPRIPHLDKSISTMTHDDIVTETGIQFPLECWVQEKVDGANLGVSWTSAPVLRNRNNILKKGYIEKETPAKLQFRPSWNWIHEHGKSVRWLMQECQSPITIYGEWMLAEHSLRYDKLPDWFLAYDIYIVEEKRFMSPDLFDKLMSQTDIRYIRPQKITFSSISDIVEYSERQSDFRSGLSEGIVMKVSDGRWITDSFKVVNKHFKRREDFNEVLIKNKLK